MAKGPECWGGAYMRVAGVEQCRLYSPSTTAATASNVIANLGVGLLECEGRTQTLGFSYWRYQ